MNSSEAQASSEAEEPPPVLDPVEPEPEPSEPPPPPSPTTEPTFEPQTWYSVTWVCSTVGCTNENTVLTDPMLYSNAGVNVRIVCGPCGKDGKIRTATKLDPQPEMS